MRQRKYSATNTTMFDFRILEEHEYFGKQKSAEPVVEMASRILSRRGDRKPDLNSFCWGIIQNQIQNGWVQCNVCGVNVSVANEGVKWCIEHARLHLGPLIFCCGLCDFVSTTRDRTQAHLRRIHKSNYEADLICSKDCEYELMEAINRCYGDSNQEM